MINFAVGLEKSGPRHFGIKKKRYAYLAIGNLRNFRFDAGDSIVVLTRIAWATIVTSVQMVSYDLQTTTWHSWLTFSFVTTLKRANETL